MLQNKEISLLEVSLLELIKSIIFFKISKSKENKEKYKERIISIYNNN